MVAQATFVPVTAEERYVADLRAQIARGDVDAEVALGNLYEAGSVLPQDPVQAAEWYRRAADKGHTGRTDESRHDVFRWRGCSERRCAGRRLVSESRRARRADRELQPGIDLRNGRGRSQARRCEGCDVVSQGRRAGAWHRAISSGVDLSRRPGSATRHDGSHRVVSEGSRSR